MKTAGRLAAVLLAVAWCIAFVPPAQAIGSFTATNIAELRAAISSANTNSEEQNVITLTPGATFTIGGAQCQASDEDNNNNGDLDVAIQSGLTPKILEIGTQKGTPATIQVDCPTDKPARVFEVFPGEGLLHLFNVVITGGRAPNLEGTGGAVYVQQGNLQISRVTFRDNAAQDGYDGRAEDLSVGEGGFGGAIRINGHESADTYGHLTIVDSAFINNRAGDGGAGLDADCSASGNEAVPGGPGGDGGAIMADDAYIDVVGTAFINNQAGDGGDGGKGDSATECANANALSGREGGWGGDGGAIRSRATKDLRIAESLFAANASGDGGAGGSGGGPGPANVFGGRSGGAGANGGLGGAIHNEAFLQSPTDPGPSLQIVNSTFDRNVAGGGGDGGDGGSAPNVDGQAGGPAGPGGCGGDGAALFDAARGFEPPDPCAGPVDETIHPAGPNPLVARYLTVTENSGGTGGTGGTGGVGQTNGADAVAGRTVGSALSVYQLSAYAVAAGGAHPICTYPVNDGTYSIGTDDTCGAFAVTSFASFGLSALGDHGGPTHTRLPSASSVLLDQVPTTDCVEAHDQRRIARPQGPACDTGAVERSPDDTASPSPSAAGGGEPPPAAPGTSRGEKSLPATGAGVAPLLVFGTLATAAGAALMRIASNRRMP
jgi:hypothetical protein